MLEQLEAWILQMDGLSLAIGVGLLSVETIKDLIVRRQPGRRFLETLASLSTQIPYIAGELMFTTATVIAYFAVYELVTPLPIPVTLATLVLALIAADFVYYWEHRLAHQVRLLWVSHAVHHSARVMNTAVAFRFGFLESPWAALIHLPLILIGFHPLAVFAGQVAVLVYQTWIHTELIGKLGPLERLFNTPANHRVHHGCDAKYLDRNYGGILMIWDRLFGTYQAEEETPRYGLARDFTSVNPLKIWFSEYPALFCDLASARSLAEARGYLFNRPGWRPSKTL
ncbi:sterol desaturase family protein [Pelagibius litoralis]|uniref:Sterol desaturase family protein n=1 Tax=Pelagibius litoralis TaxID=374515 RepID=A0A967EVQ3_9PROT|nr:sterol desaturase family protein [Pelagibius litoralis]NIA68179.1 sterol desaturase family protein [Pelagibius litoralis]